VVDVVDADDVRRIAMSLPHTVEIDSDGFDFRVGNRGFVWSYPEYIYSIRKAVITPSRIGTRLPTYRVSSATSRLCSRMKAV
jgi:hypothetical protein